MKFQFNVNETEQGYLDYSVFLSTRSHYGKRRIKKSRITITIMYVATIVILLFIDRFSFEAFLRAIPLLIVFILLQVFYIPFLIWVLKISIKSEKKSGKIGYSPSAVLSFFSECFVETTSESKTELKYSAIDRISIVDNKGIYLHENNVAAYCIPVTCFESKEQYVSFMDFIKTKCANIDFY